MSNKTYLLPLEQDEATMLWWALHEKQTQLNTRIAEFKHINWPPEAVNAAKWESEKLLAIRTKLDDLWKE